MHGLLFRIRFLLLLVCCCCFAFGLLLFDQGARWTWALAGPSTCITLPCSPHGTAPTCWLLWNAMRKKMSRAANGSARHAKRRKSASEGAAGLRGSPPSPAATGLDPGTRDCRRIPTQAALLQYHAVPPAEATAPLLTTPGFVCALACLLRLTITSSIASFGSQRTEIPTIEHFNSRPRPSLLAHLPRTTP